jgi:hypothetical protein
MAGNTTESILEKMSVQEVMIWAVENMMTLIIEIINICESPSEL